MIKKKSVNIQFKTIEGREQFRFSLTVYKSGSSTLNVNSSGRSTINYNGTTKKSP